MSLAKSFQTAVACAPSKGVQNCFRMLLDGKKVLGIPAHLAIFPKNNVWTSSNFLKDFDLNQFDWKISVKYLYGLKCENDFAWCEYDFGDNEGLFMSPLRSQGPTPVNVVYRIPFDHDCQLYEGGTWGVMQTVIDDAISSPLLEASNAGFSMGMSGAAAMDATTGACVGLFVRGGRLTNQKESPIIKYDAAQRSYFQAKVQDFLGITGIHHQLSDLTSNILRKQDIPELRQAYAMKRGIFLRSSQICSLSNDPCIHLGELEGKRAPDYQYMYDESSY